MINKNSYIIFIDTLNDINSNPSNFRVKINDHMIRNNIKNNFQGKSEWFLSIKTFCMLNSFSNIIDKKIEMNDFNLHKFIDSKHIYIFTQMWIDLDCTNEILLNSPRFMFLNVEMLTEQTRLDQMVNFLKKDIQIIDYSKANIKWMCIAIDHY